MSPMHAGGEDEAFFGRGASSSIPGTLHGVIKCGDVWYGNIKFGSGRGCSRGTGGGGTTTTTTTRCVPTAKILLSQARGTQALCNGGTDRQRYPVDNVGRFERSPAAT
ncbi:hypothetical protein Ct61P_09636 [Colletotrichum tofieldiae]|nr:hypothetical protein Ct61P_09636 [Colletotrichum tofieldiae]